MQILFNSKVLLWAVGVIQPASIKQIREFICLIFSEVAVIPHADDMEKILRDWQEQGYLSIVSKSPRYYYSLTSRGNIALGAKLRYKRDQARIFLLKEANKNKIFLSGERKMELVGDSPTVEVSLGLQEKHRPINSAETSFGRTYWPMLSVQLFADPVVNSSSPDKYLEYYSFPSKSSLVESFYSFRKVRKPSLNLLALAIGLSPRLISYILHQKNDHYRRFEIGKKSGGTRPIFAPRLFLKTIQYWILDYLLSNLKVHPSCNSYQKRKSILTNANIHIGQNYVANIDIQSFFNSIKRSQLVSFLISEGYDYDFSDLISKIITLDDGLPQGAPTSPHVSNAYMYKFDDEMVKFCLKLNLRYSRYADDITVSGDHKEIISKTIVYAEELLRRMELSLNQDKTRIASRGGQQKVTGIVVNVRASPPRKFRRRIRAIFHQAKNNPVGSLKRLNELQGYLGYLKSFPGALSEREKTIYIETIKEIKNIVNN